ncbi:CNTP5 protein, partial [Polypterus senegalus]
MWAGLQPNLEVQPEVGQRAPGALSGVLQKEPAATTVGTRVGSRRRRTTKMKMKTKTKLPERSGGRSTCVGATDAGLLTYKEHLPVSQIAIGDTDRPDSEAFYRVGPLKCYGDTPVEVTFSFDVGNGAVQLTVKSPNPLNDKQWHYVKAERNTKEASLQVDQLPIKFKEAPADGHLRLQLTSQLFVEVSALFEADSSVTLTFQEPSLDKWNKSTQSSLIFSETSKSRESISFSFLTARTPAMLFFLNTYHQEYMAVILSRNGSLQIWYRLNKLKEPDIFFTNTVNLANAQVHQVQINREGRDIYVQIDQNVNTRYTLSSDSELTAIKSLTLGKTTGSPSMDREVMFAGMQGFIGCLSSVQFNQIAPLKAALHQQAGALVTVKGHLLESNCGSSIPADLNTFTTTHSLSDHSEKADNEREPLMNAIQSDSAVIGGCKETLPIFTFALHENSQCQDVVDGRLLRHKTRLFWSLVGEQVITDPIEDDPSKDLIRHQEQFYPPVVAAIQAITLPFPDRDDESRFPVSWDDASLPNGGKDCLQCQEDSLTCVEKFTLDTTGPCSPFPPSWFTACAISVRLGGSQLIGGSASRTVDPEISNVLAGGSSLNNCSK